MAVAPKDAPADASRTEPRAHVRPLGKELQLQRLLQERDSRVTAGTAPMADDPFHRFHVAETPQLEALLDIHQLLAHVVLGPELHGLFVDAPEHRQQSLVAPVRLAPVALAQVGWPR